MQVYSENSDGTILWNASLVLRNYLQKKQSEFSGRRVLELGAGLGHLSLAISRMGAHVTSTEARCRVEEAATASGSCRCWGCVNQLRRSVKKNLALEQDVSLNEWNDVGCEGMEGKGSIRVVELQWGEEAKDRWGPLKQESETEDGKFDYIIMSEVIYNQSSDSLYDDDFHDNLIWTILQFVKPGTIIYNVFVDRPFSFMFFAKIDELPGKPFKVEVVDEKEYECLVWTCYFLCPVF
ncbi:hypothetical protein GUITHDRAFT_154621 [Guillardia theta CCMP2712]|uniref:Uncharacterized protein n=1 Tax=Guillardia theta (strain CCMP2712) TaxID=905079 RepID=L1IR92_GUITC|nr:hypothetical protein GUITHDRAFT_154621 [Guillardia theta CCMP2712]EKX38771.1 hypothetical protein GUITHDRAFT_154621 [Guillardia theta CCMP2712]|eukprot:XP_005825751.1 hypothetical protein GUITHDRAFT_154621 [Guillardia theta CCMP2712]